MLLSDPQVTPGARGPRVQPPRRVHFGPFVLDLDTGELHSGGRPVSLRPLPTRALLLLVRHAGGLVTRRDLRRSLWGGTVVEWDAGIDQAIRQVRRALGDSARRPLYVETVPRRGYRFKAAVEAVEPAARYGVRRSRLRDGSLFLGGIGFAAAAVVAFVLVCALLAS